MTQRRPKSPSMRDLSAPLTQAELDALDAFLIERVDQEQWGEGMDEGVFCLSALDGLLTAGVSGPVAVMPSQWLPAVWAISSPFGTTRRSPSAS